MSDPNNINPNKRYATAIAERGKFWPVDDDYLSSVGYDPASGESNETGKYAVLTYNVNPAEISLSGDVQVGPITIKDPDNPADQVNINSYTNSNAMTVAVVDGDGSQILDFGQLTEVQGPDDILTSKSAPFSGDLYDMSDYKRYAVHFTSSGVSTGAVVGLQHSLDGTNWCPVGQISVVEDGTRELASFGAIPYINIRAVVYSGDGTHDATIYVTN